MFCSKCGKKILDGDVFCPGCGTRIEWARFEEPKVEAPAEAEKAKVEEKFDFNWDLEDFNRKKDGNVKIEWGDLLGIEERKEAVANRMESAEAMSFAETKKEAPAKKIEEIPAEEPADDFVIVPPRNELRFDTFSRKNREFQDLLEQERERVRKNRENQAMLADEIDSWVEKNNEPAEESVVESTEVPEAVEVETPEFDIPEIEVPELEIPELDEETSEEIVPEEPVEEVPEVPAEEEASLEPEIQEEEKIEEPEEVKEEPAPEPAPEKLSFFERRRRKKEKKKAMLAAGAAVAAAGALKADENDIGGEWTEDKDAGEEAAETAEPVIVEDAIEVPETEEPAIAEDTIEVPETEEPAEEPDSLESMLAADAVIAPERKMSVTQKISRDEFSDFLKSIEAQFGIDEFDEDAAESAPEVEEPVVIPEPEIIEEPVIEDPAEPEIIEEPVIEEPAEPEIIKTHIIEEPVEPSAVQESEAEEAAPAEEEPAAAIAPAEEKKEKKDGDEFRLGEFSDDRFWEDDEEKKKGSGFGTFLIVLLAVILALQIAILVIRFQFPDTQIAHVIEPKITMIEQWIRNLFH